MGCNCGGGSRLAPPRPAVPVNRDAYTQGSNAPGYPVQSNPNSPTPSLPPGSIQQAQRKVI
jgi:hypothetical protein